MIINIYQENFRSKKNKLSELASTYKYLDSKQYITPKTQKKKRETIENEIKELKEEIEVEKDNFEFLVYQNNLYRKLFDEFKRKIEANKKKNNEDLQKEKQKRKETANQKRSEIMKMRTYSLECTLWQEIEDTEVDLNKLKTKTGKNIIKSRYRYINGQTCKKVFSSMLLIVKTNRTKGKGDFKEKYNGKIIPVVLNDKNFKNLFDILSTDKHFVDKWRYRYLTSIDYNFIEIHNIDEKSNETTNFNPAINEIHDNINNYSIYFNYINYNLNENAKTFDELMNNARETDIENSCYVQLLYDTYKEPIAKRYKNDSQRSKFNENKLLTIEKICNICGIKYKQTNMGLSLEKSVQFFKTYKLGLKAIDLFGNIIKEYKPEKYNSRISPRTLYILIHNNHCYKLNCNIKSFEQLLLDVKRQQEEFEPSSKFPVYREDTKIYKTTFINKLDDIVPHVISNKNNENIRFIYEDSMEEMILKMVINKYIPDVIYKDNSIKGITFKVKDTKYSIQYSDMTSDALQEIGEEEYYEYNKENNKINEWLLNEKFISRFEESTRKMLDEYAISPLTCQLEYTEDKNLLSIDHNKAYTSNLNDLQHIPVFNVFDKFIDYDGHEIENETYYFVETDDNVETKILLGKKLSIVFGFIIKQSGINFNIYKFCRPSTIIESNSRGKINELYQNNLNGTYNKNIINFAIGKCGKIENNKSLVKIYLNRDEANYYANKYGGVVHCIKSKSIYENVTYDAEYFVEDLFDTNVLANFKIKEIFLVVIEKHVKLVENMLPIKHHIYMNQRLKNLLLYRKLNENNIKCYAIKTDSIFVDAAEEQLNKIFEFNNKIGGIKLEKNKPIPTNRIECVANSFEEKKIEIKNYYIKNEETFFENKEPYENELKELFKNNNYIIVLGTYPGVGKSYASSLAGNNILYVTYYNELCLELIVKGLKSITLHNLMSLNLLGDDSKGKRRKQYDVSKYDTIVFEEILLYSPKLLSSIHRFMKMHPDKKIIANGDISQNLPIINNDLNNVSQKDKYLMECINILFPNRIILEVNKRLKDPEDRKKLSKLKSDIFNINKDIIETFTKYNFKIISDLKQLKTSKNISYFKSRSYKINKYVQENLVSIPKNYIEYEYEHNGKRYNFKYHIGQLIKCRNFFQRKNIRLCTNYVFKILDIDDEKNLTLRNISNNEEVTIKYDHLKYFSLPYCSTAHSVQGVSIDEPYTIFDCNHSYADRRYIWTALTRSTSFNNVTIYQHSKNEIKVLETCKIRQYYNLKIKSYIEQDINAARIKKNKQGELKSINGEIIDDYVDYDWIHEQPFKCYLCNNSFDFELVDGQIHSNLTCDRQDNSIHHSKNNCRLCCYLCNIRKK